MTSSSQNSPKAAKDVRVEHAGTGASSSSAHLEQHNPNDTGRESTIGADHSRRTANVSWGSIFAGVVTFLALTILFGLAAAAMGLGDFSSTAIGVWSAIFIIIALAAAGYVAGALAVRGGLLHGCLTWATSLLSIVLITGWVGSSLLGALGGAVGSVADSVSSQVSATDVASAAETATEQVDGQDVQQAQDQASQTASEVADTTSSGLWWTFAGALIGGVIASVMGMLGSRSVLSKQDPQTRVTTRN